MHDSYNILIYNQFKEMLMKKVNENEVVGKRRMKSKYNNEKS